ncbi:phosphoglycerate mutase family protein [Diplodia corticola]|uniref:Phosphoglycerate mutase family protein n=1 Tax=Diplodia corticola TaxID=236234 RepID=A0A1J9S112_9PEZI|nr:phosphoglycerate mutase family protein [Diplodia corticola]OJD33349.1 phosphoglycerate mutase family protein [Diplodia corticola]
MRLFLIRHGETVDNLAQVYAGSKDSELTSHGFQQAQRLARYLKGTDVRFTHIFASPLQRARNTAQAVLDAQSSPALKITRVAAIQEQDFGSFEGKSWLEGPSSSKPRPAGFVDIESKESMARRVDSFLDEHMAALWRSAAAGERCVVAIVSHGIILSVLWRRILRRLPPDSVTMRSDLLVPGRPVSLEYLGGFSNTGYLELDMARKGTPVARALDRVSGHTGTASSPRKRLAAQGTTGGVSSVANAAGSSVAPVPAPTRAVEKLPVTGGSSSSSQVLHGWTTEVITINGKEHLKGLKRTGGGLGSSKHDQNQRSIDTFFKRRRVD